MYENKPNNNIAVEDTNIVVSKPKKRYKITAVKTVPINGINCTKLGCFKTKILRYMFVQKVFGKLTNDEYTDFMREYVVTNKELEEFKDMLAFCDYSLEN